MITFPLLGEILADHGQSRRLQNMIWLEKIKRFCRSSGVEGGGRTRLTAGFAIFHALNLCTDNVQQKEIGPCEFR